MQRHWGGMKEGTGEVKDLADSVQAPCRLHAADWPEAAPEPEGRRIAERSTPTSNSRWET